MNPFLRFCFHPAPRDRIWWSAFSVVMVFVTLITAIYLFHTHQILAGLYNAFLSGWSGLSAWFNYELWQHWKKHGHLPGYEHPPKK